MHVNSVCMHMNVCTCIWHACLPRYYSHIRNARDATHNVFRRHLADWSCSDFSHQGITVWLRLHSYGCAHILNWDVPSSSQKKRHVCWYLLTFGWYFYSDCMDVRCTKHRPDQADEDLGTCTCHGTSDVVPFVYFHCNKSAELPRKTYSNRVCVFRYGLGKYSCPLSSSVHETCTFLSHNPLCSSVHEICLSWTCLSRDPLSSSVHKTSFIQRAKS